MKTSISVAGLALLLCLAFAVADAGEACKVKEKCLSIAGCVWMTTSFCDVAVGDAITIRIDSANGFLAPGNPVEIKKVSPNNQTATISQTRLDDKHVSVVLETASARAKTVHLSVYLTTGEKVGVNLKLPR